MATSLWLAPSACGQAKGSLDSDLNARHWQLFIDDVAIARATGMDRVVHQPRPLGVVIPADRPWETFGTAPTFVGRRHDGTFFAFYNAYWWDTAAQARIDRDRAHDFKTGQAYATSRDGIHWEKPILGLVEAPAGIDWEKFPPFPSPKGSSKENNLGVPFSVFDLGQYGNVTDPAKRYAIYHNGRGYFAKEIPDFLKDSKWQEKLVDSGGRFSPRGRALHFWDNLHEEWVGIVQNVVPHWLPAREVARFASKDLARWTSDVVLAPDPADSHVPHRYDEPMGMLPFCDEGVVIGLLSWFHSDRTHPDGGPVLQKTEQHPYIWPWARKGVNEMRLTLSRDGGRTWDRTSSRQAWIPHGTEEDAYDRLVIGATCPLRVGDEDWFYMNVVDGNHLVIRNSVDQMPYYRHRVVKHLTALYIQKRHRYVSLRAHNQAEVLITKPFTVDGDTLQLNVDASRGLVKVGIAAYEPVPSLDGAALTLAPHMLEHNLVAGFKLDDCEPIYADSIQYDVKFKQGASLKPLAGRKVVLFISLLDADLYGFRLQ